MTKLEKQKQIFNKFSNGDSLKEVSNRYLNIVRNNKNMRYFLVLKRYANEWQNKYIFEITNDTKARFLLKWKCWETNYQLGNGDWRKSYVIALDNSNDWDKQIIDKWEELAKGGEELIDLKDKEDIGVLIW